VGRLDEAVQAYRRAVAAGLDDASIHVSLGRTLEKLGRLEEAAAAFRQATLREPNDVVAHARLGQNLRLLGRPEEALAPFQHVARLRPGNPETIHQLGLCFAEAGHRALAAEQLRQLEALDATLAKSLRDALG
jgi:Flp pilus assembly protein TadD